MSILGNILWFICGGLLSGLSWVLAGCLWCISIIGIPIGLQCFKFAGLAFFPFGKEVVYGGGAVSLIANIYLGILLHYLLVLAAVLIFGYAFNWGNQLPVYVLAGMCGGVLILCCYLDISRVKADIDEINGLCENRV